MSPPSRIACAVPGRYEEASPAGTGMGFSAPSSASWSCTTRTQRRARRVDVLAPAAATSRVRS